ncbi:hypothetical protein BJ684DRAFT_20055 [Piptocephalis cylindrospora]|uniref:HAUS augmin-like complex subunit 4-domain-containing protein n=1 Tax=Piptocephalis cylindrospora TaxID=1907219 RepID=A0A4P9Y3H0_9FUNG|nr:hypothetical protein BJ684DRAFT_20055 [Piptocephalis cylindrospora]|eukprot:RKP13457.1 hypothetical protein BJ684DRAFT_20055 [Piptocephalis cylindrospora]
MELLVKIAQKEIPAGQKDLRNLVEDLATRRLGSSGAPRNLEERYKQVYAHRQSMRKKRARVLLLTRMMDTILYTPPTQPGMWEVMERTEELWLQGPSASTRCIQAEEDRQDLQSRAVHILQHACEDAFGFMGPEEIGSQRRSSSRPTPSEWKGLPREIREKQDNIRRMDHRCTLLQLDYVHHLRDHAKALSEYILTVKEVMEEAHPRTQAHGVAQATYHSLVMESLIWKTRSLHEAILSSIYDRRSIQALDLARSGLEQELEAVEAALLQAKTRLAHYQQSDDVYQGLIRAYTHIRNKMSQVQEDVDRIRNG